MWMHCWVELAQLTGKTATKSLWLMDSQRRPTSSLRSIYVNSLPNQAFSRSVFTQEVRPSILLPKIHISNHQVAIVTNLIRNMTDSTVRATPAQFVTNSGAPAGLYKTLDRGASTSIYAAFEPSLRSMLSSSIYLKHVCHIFLKLTFF